MKRWEAARGLPIHRIPGRARSKIYAYAQELDAWLDSTAEEPRLAASAPSPTRWAIRRTSLLGGLAILALLSLAAASLLGWRWFAAERVDRAQRLATRNPQAVELYREGWHDWNTRTPAGLARAQTEFSQALAIDPRFAQAYVGLANTYLLLREYTHMPDAVAYPKAEAAVRRALALDSDLADAHSALGFIDYWWRWEPREAEAELKRAIVLAPESVNSRMWLANILKVQLRYGEALAQINRAQTLDPDSSAVLEARGDILLEEGDVAGGRRILQHLEDIEPNQMWPHAHLAKTALVEGQYKTYLSESQKVADLKSDGDQRALLASARQGWKAGGGPGLLQRLLAQQQALAQAGKASAYDVACTYVLMNRPDDAVTWLRRAAMAHDATVLGTFSDPCFRPLTRDGRIQFLRGIVFRT
ncbi:MAG TPA: tetratricopeptide repeat protein [Phenylobacterium sp.]|uniref:tetratricopeptide repeat protein n=1 Tax=Phenylobacterium sp. TaxID=1871053 RepID=UPI002D2D60EA|nr:tetratricopeptide repeat protein [Phenylobacterium sp.]HZZ67353.1 tetratricopeptide repeat protein [Phenylobacterium sp.]